MQQGLCYGYTKLHIQLILLHKILIGFLKFCEPVCLPMIHAGSMASSGAEAASVPQNAVRGVRINLWTRRVVGHGSSSANCFSYTLRAEGSDEFYYYISRRHTIYIITFTSLFDLHNL